MLNLQFCNLRPDFSEVLNFCELLQNVKCSKIYLFFFQVGETVILLICQGQINTRLGHCLNTYDLQ